MQVTMCSAIKKKLLNFIFGININRIITRMVLCLHLFNGT